MSLEFEKEIRAKGGLELEKAYKTVRLNLDKVGMNKLTAMVVVALDYSWSTEGHDWRRYYYTNKIMHRAVQRFMPVSLALDDNGELDGIVFSDRAEYVGAVTIDDPNWRNVVDHWTSEYRRKTGLGQSGTNLLGAIQEVIRLYAERFSVANGGWMDPKPKMFDKWKLPRLVRPAEIPLVCYFWFDGDPDRGTEQQIIDLLKASQHLPFFAQFIGLGNEDFKFPKLLNNLDCEIDHVGFAPIPDITKISDDELYRDVVLGEFAVPESADKPSWVQLATRHKLIVPMQ